MDCDYDCGCHQYVVDGCPMINEQGKLFISGSIFNFMFWRSCHPYDMQRISPYQSCQGYKWIKWGDPLIETW